MTVYDVAFACDYEYFPLPSLWSTDIKLQVKSIVVICGSKASNSVSIHVQIIMADSIESEG
uniref:Uncharacterized protein n=1 Tax=Rhizophagus irregularis (strain DAOM 181602 / DAOM 197198 / MUCL 43194) TaxID=747089 RepID=U9T2A1_RHIID